MLDGSAERWERARGVGSRVRGVASEQGSTHNPQQGPIYRDGGGGEDKLIFNTGIN